MSKLMSFYHNITCVDIHFASLCLLVWCFYYIFTYFVQINDLKLHQKQKLQPCPSFNTTKCECPLTPEG